MAKGHTEIAAGWKGIEKAFQAALKNRPEEEKAQPILPEFSEGQAVAVKEAVLHEGTTSPPPRYTEDSLLSAMATAIRHASKAMVKQSVGDAGATTATGDSPLRP